MAVMAKRKLSLFASRLRAERQRVGFSRRELAERAGVSARAIVKLERDETKSVSLDTAAKLAKALGVTLGHLAGESS